MSAKAEPAENVDMPAAEDVCMAEKQSRGNEAVVELTDEQVTAYALNMPAEDEAAADDEVAKGAAAAVADGGAKQAVKKDKKPKKIRETLIKIPGQGTEYKPSWIARLINRAEAKISELSTKNNFWHRVCSWVFLPLAFRSGIKFHHGDVGTFSALLPFRRHNRNWYNAMAGGALLANSEVAGGMYVFQQCGRNYTVVCKHLSYDFHRPCFGPAVYRIEPDEDLKELIATGKEFNITVKMLIVQMVSPGDRKERRVGRCTARFHVTPKTQYRQRKKFVRQRATK